MPSAMTETRTHQALVAFGANLGDTTGMFRTVCRKMEEQPTVLAVRSSELFETEPVGTVSPSGSYTNAVFALTLGEEWTPDALLRFLLEMEHVLGRQRQTHWESRCVDLDLLLFDDVEIHDFPQLVLPHPLMPWRRFVLEPAVQVAADWVHPGTGLTIAELLQGLNRSEPRILRLSTASPEEWEAADCVVNDTLADREDVRAWARSRHLPYIDCRDAFRGGETPDCDLIVQVIQNAYETK